jgi:hypothetical protein
VPAPLPPLSGKPIVPIEEQPPDTAIQPAPVVAVSRNPTVESPLPVPQSRADGDARPKSTVPPSLDGSRRSSQPYSAIAERRKRGRKTEPPPSDEANDDAPPRESIAPAPWAPPPPIGPIPEGAPTPVRAASEAPPRPSRGPGASLLETKSDWVDRRSEPPDPPETVRYMAGASQPPFGAPAPPKADPQGVPRAPPVPRFDVHSEAAEYLGLPPGAGPEPPRADKLPRTVAEARALFTHLSRELGRECRIKRGIELRTDPNALEAMQAHLFDAYYGKNVRSLEDWLDVRRHGAFLSEILVRTLGAEWVDITASELGYWAMTVPHVASGATRVWPFARILRYVAMGPKERDLVSYYLELKSRTQGR